MISRVFREITNRVANATVVHYRRLWAGFMKDYFSECSLCEAPQRNSCSIQRTT